MTIASQHFQSTHFPKNTNTQPLSFKEVQERVQTQDSLELFSEELAATVLKHLNENDEKNEDFVMQESGMFHFLSQFQTA